MSARQQGKTLDSYTASELKLVYRVLHASLTEQPDLMDSDLLSDLQAHLHFLAVEQGVDPTDHAALDRWLGNTNARDCVSRMALRSPVPTPGAGRPN